MSGNLHPKNKWFNKEHPESVTTTIIAVGIIVICVGIFLAIAKYVFS